MPVTHMPGRPIIELCEAAGFDWRDVIDLHVTPRPDGAVRLEALLRNEKGQAQAADDHLATLSVVLPIRWPRHYETAVDRTLVETR